MQIKNIVTSKTLSEKISKYRKMGESVYVWEREHNSREENPYLRPSRIANFNFYIANAYTCTELGELMKDVDNREIMYVSLKLFQSTGNTIKDDMLLFTNPESLGQIYLYLLKEGVIK